MIKKTLVYIYAASLLVGTYLLIAWAVNAWSNYQFNEHLKRCMATVSLTEKNERKVEDICSNLNPDSNSDDYQENY